VTLPHLSFRPRVWALEPRLWLRGSRDRATPWPQYGLTAEAHDDEHDLAADVSSLALLLRGAGLFRPVSACYPYRQVGRCGLARDLSERLSIPPALSEAHGVLGRFGVSDRDQAVRPTSKFDRAGDSSHGGCRERRFLGSLVTRRQGVTSRLHTHELALNAEVAC
jgi:hypothetical protein